MRQSAHSVKTCRFAEGYIGNTLDQEESGLRNGLGENRRWALHRLLGLSQAKPTNVIGFIWCTYRLKNQNCAIKIMCQSSCTKPVKNPVERHSLALYQENG